MRTALIAAAKMIANWFYLAGSVIFIVGSLCFVTGTLINIFAN